MDGDPTPALTGRRRTRPTSIGCPNPWQPKPGRAPLIAAHAAVQTNRATSITEYAKRRDFRANVAFSSYQLSLRSELSAALSMIYRPVLTAVITRVAHAG